MAVNRPEIITQRHLNSGAVTFQGRNFGLLPTGKASERRIYVNFPTADAPRVFVHNLGKIPTQAVPVSNSVAGLIYGTVPLQADSRHIVLKCNTAGYSGEVIVR